MQPIHLNGNRLDYLQCRRIRDHMFAGRVKNRNRACAALPELPIVAWADRMAAQATIGSIGTSLLTGRLCIAQRAPTLSPSHTLEMMMARIPCDQSWSEAGIDHASVIVFGISLIAAPPRATSNGWVHSPLTPRTGDAQACAGHSNIMTPKPAARLPWR